MTISCALLSFTYPRFVSCHDVQTGPLPSLFSFKKLARLFYLESFSAVFAFALPPRSAFQAASSDIRRALEFCFYKCVGHSTSCCPPCLSVGGPVQDTLPLFILFLNAYAKMCKRQLCRPRVQFCDQRTAAGHSTVGTLTGMVPDTQPCRQASKQASRERGLEPYPACGVACNQWVF